MGEGMSGNEAAWRLPEDMGAAELLRKLAGDLLLGDAALYDYLGYGHEGFWGAEKGGVSICRTLESLADMVERELLLVELCGLLGIAPMGLIDVSRQELAREFGKRLMPEGMEWPCYEDGEPVRIGDEFECWCGETHTVGSVTIREGRSTLNESQPHSFVVSDGPFTAHGKRVKRPAPKVYDADGVEIHVGDTVCGTRDMEPMRVVDTDSRECGFKRIKCEKEGDGFFFYCADELTHKLTVLAADGKPLREGETVWDTETGEQMHVCGFENGCVITDSQTWGDTRITPSVLTHERPDSWERLEEDSACKDSRTTGPWSRTEASRRTSARTRPVTRRWATRWRFRS